MGDGQIRMFGENVQNSLVRLLTGIAGYLEHWFLSGGSEDRTFYLLNFMYCLGC